MNSENIILRNAIHSPLTTKGDFLSIVDFDDNNINIYEDFNSLASSGEISDFDVSVVYDDTLEKYVTYNGRSYMYINASATMGNLPTDASYWIEIFPTYLAHQKNRDTILDEGGADEVSANEIRAFIDGGLTTTTNLSISGHTSDSLNINSSTGTDVTLNSATRTASGLLSSANKIKLDNLTGVNTGDQTLASLNAEDLYNKVNDFTTINSVLYPTTEAVDAYLTTQVPPLVSSALTGVEIQTNKSDSYTVSSSITYASTKAVVDGLATKQASLGFTAENVANKQTNLTASSTKYPTVNAVNTGLGLKEDTANKNATNGYVGRSAGKIVFQDFDSTFTSYLYNANTAGRTYTFQDRNGTIADDTDLALKAPIASPTFTGTVTSPAVILSSETASTIASFDASKNVKSLSTATYPSLTELSYAKGVTSAIQTQIDTKAPLNPRVQTVASSATVTPVSTNDIVTITAQAVGLTLANPTGTFVEGQALMIRIKDNGTARTIAFDTNYRVIGITAPTTTVISKTMYLGIIYNSTDAKWDIVGLNQQE